MQLISIGQIIDQTFHLYQKHFGAYVRIGAWLFLSLPLLIVASVVSPLVEGSFSGIMVLAGLMLLNTIITIILGYLVMGSLIFATESFDEGKKINSEDVRTKAWSKVGHLFVQGVLLGLMLFGGVLLVVPGIAIFGVSAFREASAGVVLPALGMFLLFAGGIGAAVLIVWLSVIFPSTRFSLLLENRGIIESIRRGFALVKGRWWATMIRVVVPKLTIGVIVLFGQLLIIFFIFIVSAGIAPMAEVIGEAAAMGITTTIQQLAMTAVAAVTTPAFIIADYYVFKNLVATRRGTA